MEPLNHGAKDKYHYMTVDFARRRGETVVTLLEKTPQGFLIIRRISAWNQIDYSGQIGQVLRRSSMSTLSSPPSTRLQTFLSLTDQDGWLTVHIGH